MSELPSADVFLASAVQFLVEGNETEAAAILLSCSVELVPLDQYDYWDNVSSQGVNIIVFGPRAAYNTLDAPGNPPGNTIREAFRAAMPWDKYINDVIPRAQPGPFDQSWRRELEKVIKGKGVNNQAVPIEGSEIQLWHGLRFRSKVEVKIAQSLQGRGVLYFPNCLCRIRQEDGFGLKEPDFLVCQEGKWGILEVDGEPWHGGHTRAKEQKKDISFHRYGIKVVLHFSASECWSNPDAVVDEFLQLLRRNG